MADNYLVQASEFVLDLALLHACCHVPLPPGLHDYDVIRGARERESLR
jgi:hypothetical protein